eukprot:TRINITY_DN1148_c0_g1_i9.p1 TRINITY_DN1148_c0_g1~~TRINITY_DN1148_c0_g1_i9.p1  ORF type:complete len:440 (-),score=53.78 TRINITY_DN1148_c0_g1_i9:105-1424(-)
MNPLLILTRLSSESIKAYAPKTINNRMIKVFISWISVVVLGKLKSNEHRSSKFNRYNHKIKKSGTQGNFIGYRKMILDNKKSHTKKSFKGSWDSNNEELLDYIKQSRSVNLAGLSSINIQDTSSCLKSNQKLTALNLNGKEIADSGALLIFESIRRRDSLVSLNMEGNMLGERAMQELKFVTIPNRNIKTLNLRDNYINVEAAKYIAEAIKFTPCLQTLKLGVNRIGNDGLKYIIDSINDSSRISGITHLDVSGNYIGNEGAALISNYLQQNRSLTTLNLKNNNIDDAGAIQLAKSLSSNSTLTELNLVGNKILLKGLQQLFQSLLNSSTMNQIHVGNTYTWEEPEQVTPTQCRQVCKMIDDIGLHNRMYDLSLNWLKHFDEMYTWLKKNLVVVHCSFTMRKNQHIEDVYLNDDVIDKIIKCYVLFAERRKLNFQLNYN